MFTVLTKLYLRRLVTQARLPPRVPGAVTNERDLSLLNPPRHRDRVVGSIEPRDTAEHWRRRVACPPNDACSHFVALSHKQPSARLPGLGRSFRGIVLAGHS